MCWTWKPTDNTVPRITRGGYFQASGPFFLSRSTQRPSFKKNNLFVHHSSCYLWVFTVFLLVETWDGESTETDSQCESCNGCGLISGVSDDQKEDGLHSEASAVENFTNGRRRQNVISAEVIGQLSSDRDDDGHHQVRQSCERSHLNISSISQVLKSAW